MPEEFKDKMPEVMRARHNLNVENTQHGNPRSVEQQNTEQAGMYKINTLYFYLTEGCNLACRHCWNTS